MAANLWKRADIIRRETPWFLSLFGPRHHHGPASAMTALQARPDTHRRGRQSLRLDILRAKHAFCQLVVDPGGLQRAACYDHVSTTESSLVYMADDRTS